MLCSEPGTGYADEEEDNPFADSSISTAAATTQETPKHQPTATVHPGNNDTPSWLNEAPESAAPKQYPSHPEQPSGQYVPSPHAPQPTEEQARIFLSMRLVNVGLSVLLAAASAVTILSVTSLTTGVICLYIFVFACLLCCFETHLTQIKQIISTNFGFLYNAKGRAVFLLFIGLLSFNLGLLGKIAGGLMLANAVFNFYIICKYPEYEAITLQQDGAKDAKQFMESHPELKQQAVQGAVTFAKDNPQVVTQSWA